MSGNGAMIWLLLFIIQLSDFQAKRLIASLFSQPVSVQPGPQPGLAGAATFETRLFPFDFTI
jgi:hypothetical protein